MRVNEPNVELPHHAAIAGVFTEDRQRQGSDTIRAAQFPEHARSMFQWALREGRIPINPTGGVTREKVKTSGYPTWSEVDIERLEAAHPIGTKERLAFALILYTGLRRGDVVKVGRQHVHDGVLTIGQGKTEGGEEAHLEIPLHPKLREIIDATPTLGVKLSW